LLDTYHATQARLRGGDLDTPELVLAVLQFDRAAILLARYAADQPAVLAELLQIADHRHHAAFLQAANAHREPVAAALRAALERKPETSWTDDEIESLAVQRANAAASLLHLGDPAPVWEMLRHSPDPTARSHLIHGLGRRGVEARILVHRYEQEPDLSARRALLLTLGEYDPAWVPAADRDRLTARLLAEFRDHPDAGLHGAIDWLLRQKWGKSTDLDRIVAELARGERQRPVYSRTPVADAPGSPTWFINKQGQTFTVIPGPVEFMMGSPPDEPGREEGAVETQYRKRIGRSFAIAAREVTVAEYLRFNEKYQYRRQYAPAADGPIIETNWYAAAAYCRWLSEREGVPEDQMCYPPVPEIKAGMRLPADFLARTGYRLPTEAEWEYACRAGAATARPYGRGTDLLTQYAWGLKNSRDRLWPGGRLKPNDFGLFDMLGNAWEWCQDEYSTERSESDDNQVLIVSNDKLRLWRGGSFIYRAPFQRSGARYRYRPDDWGSTVGLRPTRTVR
jgi:formylglycine-generating enzyme required for sulfatase activity